MYYKITTKDEIIFSKRYCRAYTSMEFEAEKIWQKNSDVIIFEDTDCDIAIIPKTEIKKIEIIK